jgi:hypothetical protein
MLIKPVILALLAVCGVNPNPATTDPPPSEQPDKKPPEDVQKDQHFCCFDVDPKAMTGDGCTAISGALETINACQNLLYCEGNYTKKDGTVTCE